MSLVKPIYEFLVWDNCSNNCQFCFQRSVPRLFSLQQQECILKHVESFLSSSRYEKNSHVLIVGGELFDDVARSKFLISFFTNLAMKMAANEIDLLYINTNLIYSLDALEKNAIEVLNVLSKMQLSGRVRFTTSFDLAGRFRSNSSKSCFFNNLHTITHMFPNIDVVVNMILTKQMCENVVDGKFDIFNFMEEHHVSVNLIPYIVLDESLAPSRQLVFAALQKLASINAQFVSDWINNIDLKQPRKMFYCDSRMDFISCECQMSPCGHSKNFRRYSESKSCFVCDMKEVLNAFT